MKNFKLFILLLTVGLPIHFVSCQTNDPISVNKVTLEGGGNVTIGKTDITKEFTVKSELEATEDIIVALTTNATDGEATLSQSEVIIKKGEMSAKAEITFIAAKFTEGAPSKDISVSTGDQSITYTLTTGIGSDAKRLCEVDFGFINYVVARWFSVGDYNNPEHPVIASSQGQYGYDDKTAKLQIDISEGDAISITMANLNSTVTDNYAAVAWVDWNTDGQLSESEEVVSKTIIAGEHFNTKDVVIGKLKAPSGTADGIYYMRIGVLNPAGMTGGCGTSENGDVTDLAINYTSTPSTKKPVLSIQSLDPNTVEVTDKDYTGRITISLNRALSSETTVTLKASSSTSLNGTLSTSTVVFAAGELSKTVTIKFAAADFPTPNEKAVVTITPECSSTDIHSTYKNVVLEAKGINRIRVAALYSVDWLTFDGAVVIKNEPNIEHTLLVNIKTKDAINVTAKTVFTPKITGMLTSDYFIEPAGTIAIESGKNATSFNLYIRSKAIGKTMTLTLESENADIAEGQQPIVIEALDKLPDPVLQDAKLTISVNGSKTMTSFVGMASVLFEATNGVIPRLVTITPTTTGDITTDDFSFVFSNGTMPQIISANKNSVRIRFNESIKGKKGTISFTSPYSTFAADGFITVDIPK